MKETHFYIRRYTLIHNVRDLCIQFSSYNVMLQCHTLYAFVYLNEIKLNAIFVIIIPPINITFVWNDYYVLIYYYYR